MGVDKRDGVCAHASTHAQKREGANNGECDDQPHPSASTERKYAAEGEDDATDCPERSGDAVCGVPQFLGFTDFRYTNAYHTVSWQFSSPPQAANNDEECGENQQ